MCKKIWYISKIEISTYWIHSQLVTILNVYFHLTTQHIRFKEIDLFFLLLLISYCITLKLTLWYGMHSILVWYIFILNESQLVALILQALFSGIFWCETLFKTTTTKTKPTKTNLQNRGKKALQRTVSFYFYL